MDLEGLAEDVRQAHHATRSLSIQKASKQIDAKWHSLSGRARWMDLLGDYAGIEPFIIDGNSLIQLVIDNPLLALGKPGDPSFQILHAFHILECTLGEFVKRSAVFDIVFWEQTRHYALKTGVGESEEASRSLARRLLFNHLLKSSNVSVHVFSGLSDPRWKEYRVLRKPMFVLINDGDTGEDLGDHFVLPRLLCHRGFLCDLLASGLALALLDGAEFHDSKVFSFVYESRSRGGDLPTTIRKACSLAAHALEGKATNISLFQSSTSLASLRAVTISDIAVMVASKTHFTSDRETALFFAFLVHLVLLDRLSTQDRARRLEPMQADFKHQLVSDFLPKVFRAVESAIVSLSTTVDVDVRVFIAVVRFFVENNTLSVQATLGSDVANIIQNELSSFRVPISTFSQFSAEFLPSPTLALPPAEHTLELLPFSNKIFDDELAPIHTLSSSETSETDKHEKEEDEGPDDSEGSGTDEWDTSSEEEAAEKETNSHKPSTGLPSRAFFDDGTLFNDTRHWHNHKKPLLPRHLGGEHVSTSLTIRQRNRKLRADQRFMKTLHHHAATLTGASGAALHQIKIPLVKGGSRQSVAKKQSHTHPTASKTMQKQSKVDAIREKNIAQKDQKLREESIAWLRVQMRDLESKNSASLEMSLSDLKRNKMSDEPFVATNLALYQLHRMFQDWISDPQRESEAMRDKNCIVAIRTIKGILEIHFSTGGIRKCIQDVLNVLGFSAYANTLTIPSTTLEDRSLMFKFVELVEQKTQVPLYSFMQIKEHPVEWQLRMFGEYMDRSMDSRYDPRVRFKPDAWQRQVLDAIDEYKSLLVVAPTSAGKTFISFYAMEKILRGSDDGVIVYVAPTKALVTQVAAEVYARFSKDLKSGSCWAIHTRDYRIHDPQNCQILVTVPEMLAIMLLSPPLARVWTPRVKYIILDEIHTIGQHEGGSVWEQILLLAPCSIIGLSATVGSPEKFNTWLEAVQLAGGFQHTFIHHPHRYSHLRKFFYNIYEKPCNTFESVSSHTSSGRMRFLHPIAMLAFGPGSIPSDLALEASDTLTLYQALVRHGDIPTSTLDALNPLKFFPSDRLLQQKDIIAFEEALKTCLASLISMFDPRDKTAPLYKVIMSLQDPTLCQAPTKATNSQQEQTAFKEGLIYLVCDLHAQGDLPAIFFNFDRTDCEVMATTLRNALVTKEKEWRASNVEWKRKITQYEEWRSRAKDRQRAAARAARNRVDPDDVLTETTEWQESFNPNAPLPQFSLAGQHASYTQNMLEDELKQLARWTSTPNWALQCLRRGIAVHHAGMNKSYRSIVESLFRQGFIRVVFATGTLALGINAPTKTSVFCGDSPYLTALTYRQCAGRAGRRGYDLLGKVVFYGLPMDRVQRLALSKLPSLSANFPVTSTLILRLFNLLEGSDYTRIATQAVQRLFRLPQVCFDSDEGKDQLLHHLRFSIEYLRRARLLDEHGHPFNLFGIASHLYYTEPSNFALVTLLRHGVLHRICGQPSVIQAKRDFILLMSHLFGRRYLPTSYLKGENTAAVIKNSASMVILPPLLEDARRVLAAHEAEVLQIFTSYALVYSSQHGTKLGPDTRLPLSDTEYSGASDSGVAGEFGEWLQRTSIRVTARSLFVANSGHDDRFESVADLARTSRRGLNLNEHSIPTFAPIFERPTREVPAEDGRQSPRPARSHGFALNAYILDFYTHGQSQPLSNANAIRHGDVWYVLQEFALTLMTVRGVLFQLITRTRNREQVNAREESDTGEGQGEAGESEDLDSGFVDMDDPTEKDDEADHEEEGGGKQSVQVGSAMSPAKPAWVKESDWRVYEIVHEVTVEFEEKFKAIWA